MPTISVERCYKSFRLITPQGKVEHVSNPDGGYWDRSAAIKAKDIFANLYGMKRKNIKFCIVN